MSTLNFRNYLKTRLPAQKSGNSYLILCVTKELRRIDGCVLPGFDLLINRGKMPLPLFKVERSGKIITQVDKSSGKRA
jgi:hypothetical protein